MRSSLSLRKVLQDHKSNPPEKSDLVQVMLTGRDKETGLGLSDENIKYNVCDGHLWIRIRLN